MSSFRESRRWEVTEQIVICCCGRLFQIRTAATGKAKTYSHRLRTWDILGLRRHCSSLAVSSVVARYIVVHQRLHV